MLSDDDDDGDGHTRPLRVRYRGSTADCVRPEADRRSERAGRVEERACRRAGEIRDARRLHGKLVLPDQR